MNISPSELWVKQTALPSVGGPRLIIWRHQWPKGWSALSKKRNSARRWSLGFFNCHISIFLGSSAYWSTLKMLDLSGPMTAWANSLIIKVLLEIKPESSLEGLMLKLKLHYLGNLIQRADSLEKTVMLGKIEGSRRRGPQRMRWLDGTTNSMDMYLKQTLRDTERQGSLACCNLWGCKEVDMT